MSEGFAILTKKWWGKKRQIIPTKALLLPLLDRKFSSLS